MKFSNVPPQVKIDFKLMNDRDNFYNFTTEGNDKYFMIKTENVEDQEFLESLMNNAGDPEFRAKHIASVTEYKA